MAEQTSSYLRYLPPVLWSGDAAHSDVGRILLVFEKILRGIDDGVPLADDHPGLEVTIDRLHEVVDPWKAGRDQLPRLAAWLGLDLPGELDEYQRRKAIAEIAAIHRMRGLKEGLRRQLGLFTVAAARPRIVIDNCALVLVSRLRPDQAAEVDGLAAQGPFLRSATEAVYPGLVRPRAIALSPDGDLIIGDAGMRGDSPPVGAGVWRLTATGGYRDQQGSPPKPAPLGRATPPATPRIGLPGALAVDARSSPWRLYVLDFAGSGLFRLTAPGLDVAERVATRQALQLGTPAAMALDRNGHLLILDRSPAVLDVDVATTPPGVVRHPLTQVQEPRSLLVRADGTLVVGDMRGANETSPGELVLIDRTDAANWQERRLLAGVDAARNPIVAPFALVEEEPARLLVLDIGLRPDADEANPFLRTIAEPAVVHRVILGPGPPVVARATEPGRMVYPRGMVLQEGTLFVCDGGEPETSQRKDPWRTAPHQFGVLVHFSKQRPTTERTRRAVLREIRDLVALQKPAAATATLLSANTADTA